MKWDEGNTSVWWDENYEVESQWDEGNVEAFKLWPTDGKRVALIDADMLPYIVGFTQSEDNWFSALKEVEGFKLRSRKWYRGLLKSKYCKPAIAQVNSVLNSWVRNSGADAAKLYLTDGDWQYRFKIAMSKEYKAGPSRKKAKPPFFHFLKMYLEKEHKAIVATECEADDLMSIEQWQSNQELVADGAEQGDKSGKRFSKTIIVTKDKDLRMIPGWHSNPNYEKGKPFWVEYMGSLEPVYQTDKPHLIKELKGTGLKFFYAQLLMGDVVDNYPGLPGMGATNTYRLLKDANTEKKLFKIVKARYILKYGEDSFTFKTWDDKNIKVTAMDLLVEQGRMAWMQREPEEMWMSKHKLPRG